MSSEIEEDNVETLLTSTLRWAVSYGDLMSVLMILFLLLYSFSIMKGTDSLKRIDSFQKVFGSKEDVKVANTVKQIKIEDELAKEIKGFIDENQLTKYAIVKVDEFQIKIMLTQSSMFDKNSMVLLPTCTPILIKLADMLKIIKNNVVIEGHTDDLPISNGSNFELSAKRAYAVVNFLEKRGVPSDRFSIMGYSSYRPVAPNDTEENRQKNRRVEITIVRKYSDLIQKEE